MSEGTEAKLQNKDFIRTSIVGQPEEHTNRVRDPRLTILTGGAIVASAITAAAAAFFSFFFGGGAASAAAAAAGAASFLTLPFGRI